MRTEFVNSDGVSLAYQVMSQDGPTMLYMPGVVSHLTMMDAVPQLSTFLTRCGTFTRHICIDKRGQGLSDRIHRPPTIEQQVRDVEAIRQATNTDRMILRGVSHGAALAVLYAIAHPDRVSHLILTDGLCADVYDPEGPFTDENALSPWDTLLREIEQDFGRWLGNFAKEVAPDADPADQQQAIAFLQSSTSASGMALLMRSLIMRAAGERAHRVLHW